MVLRVSKDEVGKKKKKVKVPAFKKEGKIARVDCWRGNGSSSLCRLHANQSPGEYDGDTFTNKSGTLIS